MKNKKLILFITTFLLYLTGCLGNQVETMDLLDREISEIQISKSKGFGGMNEDIILSIDDSQSVKTFKQVITSAEKQVANRNIIEPEYDVMVVYESEGGDFPTHGLHLWLGEEDEESAFMYIGDETIYIATPKNTNKLRSSILTTS